MSILKKPTLLIKVFIVFLFFSFSTILSAQDDSEKEKKAKSSFKVSAGGSLNALSLDSANGVESSSGAGYDLGLSYKRGRFFYYEIGARYNYRSFIVSEPSDDLLDDNSFSVSALDIPLTGGVNLTSFADRLIGVRLFLSAVPSFSIGEDVDKVNLSEDDIASFLFYGQGGVGIDIAFFFVELGYNYGFSNIINDINNQSIKSNPSQGYLNLGFRF